MERHESETCLLSTYLHVYKLPSCTNYYPAPIVIYKLEKKPMAAYRPLVVFTYCL